MGDEKSQEEHQVQEKVWMYEQNQLKVIVPRKIKGSVRVSLCVSLLSIKELYIIFNKQEPWIIHTPNWFPVLAEFIIITENLKT